MLTGQLVIIQTSSLSFRRPKIVKSDSKQVDLSRYVISGTGTTHKSGVRSEVWAGLGFSTQEGIRFTPRPSWNSDARIPPGLALEPKCLHFCDALQGFLGEGNGTPLQYSCLENPMDGGAWWAAVHGVTKSWTQLRNFTFTFHFHALEKEMATHSSVLARRIPGMGKPGGLLSMGSHRVGHD